MAVAFVQNQVAGTIIVANGSQTTFTYTLLHTFTSGNSLTGYVYWDHSSNNITSITDNASPSNTYTLLDSITVAAGSAFVQSFALVNITNVPTTITITCSGAPANGKSEYMILDEISGAGTVNAHTGLMNASTTTPTSGNMTTTVAGCLVWGGIAPNALVTTSAGSGFTLALNNTSNGVYSEYTSPNQSAAGSIAATASLSPASAGPVVGIAFAPPVFSFTLISHTGASSSNGTTVTTSAISTTGANLIVVAVSESASPAVGTLVDNQSNSWVVAAVLQDGSGANRRATIFYSVNPTVNASHTFSVSGSNSQWIGVQAWIGSGGIVDQTNGASTDPSSTSSVQPGSITPTQNNELVVTSLLINSNTSSPACSGFTVTDSGLVSGGIAEGGGLAYLVQTTAAAANPTWSWTTAGQSVSVIASFKVPQTGAGLASGTYYVDNSIGSDSYDGTAQTHTGGSTGPWASIAHVNAQIFNGNTNILFNGAQTFSGAIALDATSWGTTTAPSSSAPVTLGSYGGGTATISSGAVNGASMLNIGGWVINNLNFTGSGATANVISGIWAPNTSMTLLLDYCQIRNAVINGYGAYGIFFKGYANRNNVGFNHVTIDTVTVHDCGSCAAVGGFSAGILIEGGSAVGQTNPNILNLLLNKVTMYNINGTGSALASSGAGIYLSQVGTGTCQYSVVHDISSATADPAAGNAGIQFSDSSNVTVQFCEVYNVSDGGQNIDGDGYNVSECSNGLIQYCYSHHNDGCGYLLDNGFSSASATVTMRYCISENDGQVATNTTHAGIILTSETGNAITANVYNNTIYCNTGAAGVSFQGTISPISGNFVNNIFSTTTGQSITSTGNVCTFNGNDYYRTSGFSLIWNGTTYTSLASWKVAFPSQETINGGFTSNPSLVNPGGGGTTNGYNPYLLTAYLLQLGSAMKGAGLGMQSNFSIDPGKYDYFSMNILNPGTNVGAADTDVMLPNGSVL